MTKSNKIHAIIYTILGIGIIFTAVMWYRCYQREKQLNTAVNNAYDRAFFELADYVSNIDALLAKAQLAATPAQMASISNEIFMQAAEAKSCFGQLPTQSVNLENTAQFLSQVGDYTYVLSQSMINGTEISKEEYDNLNALNQYATSLKDNLTNIEQRINSGEISVVKATDSLFTVALADDNGLIADLENVEKSFEGYPALIYDGPFSEHIENMQSYMLSAAAPISQEEALKKAKEFLGKRGEGLQFETEMNNTAIDCYVFGKTQDDVHTTISITKKGGYVLYFLENRAVNEMNYDVAAATELALQFLNSCGFYDCVSSYYEVNNNTATINFAYSQDGTKCYSDLIKVRVALDNGDITGIECKGYLMNHRERDLSNVLISQEEAESLISTHLDVTAVSMAVIPKDSLQEVLCYEFKGTYLDRNFIIYVNAENGREENILLLIESDTGILTI